MSSENETAEQPQSGPRRATIVFILVTVLLDVLSLSVTIPVRPKLIEGMIFANQYQADGEVLDPDTAAEVIAVIRQAAKGGEEADLSQQSRPGLTELGLTPEQANRAAQISMSSVTANANWYSGLMGFAWALMQFVFSPVMGVLSDRFGRRRVILISCLGLAIDYILMARAPNITWLFIGSVLSGLTAASFATANAYIADVTPPEKRAATFGLIGAAWGFGFVFGPWFGGMLGGWDLRLPFWVAAGLALLNLCYGFFILPESLAPEKRSQFSLAKANPVGSLKLYASNRSLLGFAVILLLYQIAHQVFPCVFVFYAGHRYGWDVQQIGNTLMIVGLASVFMQGFVIRRAAPWLGETRMLYIALAFGAAGYFVYGIAGNGWIFLSAIPVFSFVGFFSPAIQGLMTRLVGESQQGQLQGANSSLMGISGMIGPLVFPFVFRVAISNSENELPGAPFLMAAGLHLLAILVALVVVRKALRAEPAA